MQALSEHLCSVRYEKNIVVLRILLTRITHRPTCPNSTCRSSRTLSDCTETARKRCSALCALPPFRPHTLLHRSGTQNRQRCRAAGLLELCKDSDPVGSLRTSEQNPRRVARGATLRQGVERPKPSYLLSTTSWERARISPSPNSKNITQQKRVRLEKGSALRNYRECG